MSAFEESLQRVIARHSRRAISKRTSSSISPDPAIAIGIATIKIVTEEHIQAVAFGSFDTAPQVVERLDPIGRDVTDLLPFAHFLNGVADRALQTGTPMRIWVPHEVTLEALDVLGHRYANNQSATDEIRRMGQICRIIAHEARIPGQQLVANAAALLKDHCVTGLAPIEEGHLDAILAWLDPAVSDPLTEARNRIRLPASGILPNTPDHPIDDRVDRLRKEAKAASGTRRHTLEGEIRSILSQWVTREWALLTMGRRGFQSLGLPASGLDDLVSVSWKRVEHDLQNGFYPARAPHRLVIELSTLEASKDKADIVALENDPTLREQASRAGGVVHGNVVQVDQQRPKFNPCHIHVESDQNVIRLRQDDKVKVVGSSVKGVVRRIRSTATGGTRISIEITSGVRQTAVLRTGVHLELLRDAFGFVNLKALSEANVRQPWIFYGNAPPSIASTLPLSGSALAIARSVRHT